VRRPSLLLAGLAWGWPEYLNFQKKGSRIPVFLKYWGTGLFGIG